MSTPRPPRTTRIPTHCPYCEHGRILRVGASLDQPEGWKCECDSCHACGPSEKTEDAAIKTWNRVADAVQAMKQVKRAHGPRRALEG